MRLRSISILSLLSLWLCVSQAVPLRGQEAAPAPAIPPAEISLPAPTPAATPPHAQPGPTISSSVSTNKQFVVHGADLTVRSAFCLMSEETAGTLGRLLKDDGRYAIPVVVEVKTPPNINPSEPPVKYRITLMDFGGFHLQISVQLRNDFRTEDYTRELVRILLAERILRNHKDINTEREKPILPEWLLTGVMQAMEFRSRNRPSVLFAAVFKSGQVYSIDRILAADPKNLDALSRGVYEVSSCALLLTLLDQPDGPVRVSRFLGALATDDRPDRELLQQHFPTLGASKNSLEKWWTLQMASLSTPSAFETMTIKETEEMLDKALTLHFTDRIGEEPADIKAGREGKGIFGWLKRDDKAKDKEKEQPKTEEATAAVSSNTLSMPISTTPSSALPVEGNAANFPPPLGTPAPGSDLPPLPSSLAPSSSSGAPTLPQDTLETPPAAPATAPSAADGGATSLPETEKEEAEPAKPDGEAQPQKTSAAAEPAPAKPKPRPRRSAPKPVSEPKPAAGNTNPATAPSPAPAVTPQQGSDKATDKPAEPAATPEGQAPEEKKERSRFRFPKIFGGKNVTYTIMLLAMAAVAENASNAKENEKETPAVIEPQTAAPAEAPASLPKNNRSVGSKPEAPAAGALPKNNRRVGSKPAGVPETPAPAAPTTPPPAPAPIPAAPTDAAAPAGPEAPQAEEAPPTERKPSRFNPLRWFKREDKEKTEEATPIPVPAPPSPGGAVEAEKPATGSAAPKSSQNSNSNSASRARASTPPPEKPVDLPTQPAHTPARSSNSKIKSELAALEDYRRIWKRSDREAIFNRNLAMLNALKARAHPLYKPLVEDYTTVVQQLVDGKDRGIAEKLETLRQRRMQIQGKAKAVESFLDWYEASETQNYSNLFDDYLKLRDRLERERTQRPDELSRTLDSLEKEYE